MQYLFICKECLEMEDKNISMADYDEEKDKQTCSKCGGKMERVIDCYKEPCCVNGDQWESSE